MLLRIGNMAWLPAVVDSKVVNPEQWGLVLAYNQGLINKYQGPFKLLYSASRHTIVDEIPRSFREGGAAG